MILEGLPTPMVRSYVAPELDTWDRWNYARTEHLLEAVSARYVPPGVYGTDALDQYGNWREVPTYGAVWVPQAIAPDWVPYSTGRSLGLRGRHLGLGTGPGRPKSRLCSRARRVLRRAERSRGHRHSVRELGGAGLGRARRAVVGPVRLRRAAVVERLGRAAHRQQRRRQPEHRRQRQYHQRVPERERP